MNDELIGDYECSECGYAEHNPKTRICTECGGEMCYMMTTQDELNEAEKEITALRSQRAEKDAEITAADIALTHIVDNLKSSNNRGHKNQGKDSMTLHARDPLRTTISEIFL